MISALRVIPPADRPAAIDAAARRFSWQATAIDAAGLAIFIAGAVVVWAATPGSNEIGRSKRPPAAEAAGAALPLNLSRRPTFPNRPE